MHNKIKNYIPFETNILEFKESHYIQVQISQPMNSETKSITMNISYDEPWEDIKSSIDAHLKCILTRDCPLCFVTDKDRLFREKIDLFFIIFNEFIFYITFVHNDKNYI